MIEPERIEFKNDNKFQSGGNLSNLEKILSF